MIEYVWTETYDRAVELFDGTPGAALEERLLQAFRERPAAIVAELETVAADYRRGLIRSPWAILATRAERAGQDVTVRDSRDRDRAVAGAERWIRSTGVHFERESQVLAELFEDGGERGPILKPWAEELELRERMAELWRQERPRGVQTELEAEERGRARV
jgi:hypothetical protein